jgi:hypothetical protein
MTQSQPDASAGKNGHARSKDRAALATEISVRIDHLLTTRHAARGTFAAEVESVVKRQGGRLWMLMKRRPWVGVVVVSGGAFALADVLGAGELTIALILGYAAYRVLREGVPPTRAVEEAMKAM